MICYSAYIKEATNLYFRSINQTKGIQNIPDEAFGKEKKITKRNYFKKNL